MRLRVLTRPPEQLSSSIAALNWFVALSHARWLISDVPGVKITCQVRVRAGPVVANDGRWSDVTSTQPILVHVLPEAINERPVFEKLMESLTAEIAEHDVESVRPVEPTDVPADAKGLSVLAGWIAVQVSFRHLARLVQSLVGWAARNNHDIEIRYGEDVIHVTRATSTQQEKLISEWLDRHAGP